MKKWILCLSVLFLFSTASSGISQSSEASRSGKYFKATAGTGSFADSTTRVKAFINDTKIFDEKAKADSEFVFGSLASGSYQGYFRIEGEFSYHGASHEDTDFTFLTPTVNVYGDLPLGDRVDVFLGAGIGGTLANITVEDDSSGSSTTFSGNDTSFVYQVKPGVAVHFTDKIALEAGYRIMAITSDLSFSDTVNNVDTTIELSDVPNIQTAEVSLRLSF